MFMLESRSDDTKRSIQSLKIKMNSYSVDLTHSTEDFHFLFGTSGYPHKVAKVMGALSPE